MTRPRLYTIEVRVTFRMEKRLRDALQAWADQDGVSRNTLMQRELANALERKNQPIRSEEDIRRDQRGELMKAILEGRQLEEEKQ